MIFIRRKSKVLLLWFFALIIFCAVCWSLNYLMRLSETRIMVGGQPRVLLWWTESSLQMEPMVRYCGFHLCTITNDRRLLPESKVVLFYGSNMDFNDMPVPRDSKQWWALLHEESPRNVPYLLFDDALRHFNYTATFSRHSDFPLTTLSLPNSQSLISMTYVMPLRQKHSYLISPIMFLQSNCDTMSGRTEYVRELMKYIPIDSYGSCLHNRDLPPRLQKDYLQNLHSPELYRFMAKYKFVLAFENGVCVDYITEKYWRPLIVGSVPIYFGSPAIRDWEPNNNSAIYISDFNSPKELADFVKKVDGNDQEYMKYLRHKYSQTQPISNQRLQLELLNRNPNDNIFDDFACAMCSKLHEEGLPEHKVATSLQYNCPLEEQYPKMKAKFNESSQWYSILKTNGCIAKVIDQLLQRNEKYTANEFDEMLNKALNSGFCGFEKEKHIENKSRFGF